MWNFSSQKESTDNHHWRPGSLGAGYITAPTNTPDSFDLLNMDVRTWVIGPDQTQDVHREYMRGRPVTPILFQFYISPTGGIHDGGKGFKNRTGKPVKAVIEYLRRLDNRLYDGNEEIKVNRLSGVEKEATIHYKDIMRGQVPPGIKDEDVHDFIKYIKRLVNSAAAVRVAPEEVKKLVPWLVLKIKQGDLIFESSPSTDGRMTLSDGATVPTVALLSVAKLFSTKDTPWLDKLVKCEACDGQGNIEYDQCFGCQGEGLIPTGAKADISKINFAEAMKRAYANDAWEENRRALAELKETVQNQNVVYKFGGKFDGWYVTKMNQSAEEAEFEGRSQGNCFQSDQMPYQQDVENGNLTVYVLRDPKGLGHALWGYNPNGTIRVMEDSSKLYNKPGAGWSGYEINNDWIRQLVTEANKALGLSDEYSGYDAQEAVIEYEIQKPVQTVDELFEQYGDSADLWNMAQEEAADEPNIIIDEDTLIFPGRIEWQRVAHDFFSTDYKDSNRSEEILNEITYIASTDRGGRLNEFDEFVEAFNSEAEDLSYWLGTLEEDERRSDQEVELWKKWKELHTDPKTGEVAKPRLVPWGFRQNLKHEKGPWAHEYPSDEEVIGDWHGLIPASRDPELLKGQTVEDEITCQRCKGSGRLIDLVSGNVYCPQCEGKGKVIGPVVFPDPKSKLALCQSCGGSGVDQRKVEHFEKLVENAKINGIESTGYDNANIIADFEAVLKRPDLQNTDLRCDACNGTGKSEPVAKLTEDPSGQLKFGKKKLWNMTPISFADELKLHVASIEPKHSHSLSWVKGGKGRGLMLNDGALVTWPVNKKGEPHHPDMYEYLTGTKLPPEFLPEHFEEGTPFDIYEDGTLAFFSDDVPADLISDLSKIDYRLKVSKAAKKEFTKEDAIELLEKNNWDFDANEFFMGMNDELEHTDVTHGDPEITAKIVADHLKEHSDYYSRLHKTFKKSKVDHQFDFHFNPFTGEPCTCGYNYVLHTNHKQASQSVRKIKNQKQKFLQDDKGQAILNYLHKLISGFGIDEQGDFGHGEVPGLEGMVPWIIKQIKTGHIRPVFDEWGNCTGLRSFYGSESYAKRDLAERLQARPLLVVGDDGPIDDLIAMNKEENWPIVSDPNTPNIGFVWCNDDTMSPRNLETFAAAVPEDCKIYLTKNTVLSIVDVLQNDPEYEQFREENSSDEGPFVNLINQIPREIKTAVDFNSNDRNAFGRGLQMCKNGAPDLSKVSMHQLADRHFTAASLHDWAKWFNAQNAPARRGRNKDQIKGAVNRAIKQMEYRQQRAIPGRIINTEITASNNLFMALLAEELKVDGTDLTRQWLALEESGNNLNEIIEKLSKHYTANIDEMSVERVDDLSRQHRNYLKDLHELERLKEMFEGLSDETAVYRIKDPAYKGWTVNRIRDREEAEMESAVLGHCIGDDGQNYVGAIEDGRIEAFSLRDSDGIPKLTWHYNPDGTLAHIQVKSSDSYQIFRHLVTEFNDDSGRDNDGGGTGSEDDLNPGETYWQLDDVATMEDWTGQREDPWHYAQEEAERAGERLAEECEIDVGGANWDDIAEDFMESTEYREITYFLKYLTMYGSEYDMSSFAERVEENLEYHKEFYEDELKDPNSKYRDTIDLFKSWIAANTSPVTGHLKSPRQVYSEDVYDAAREEIRQSMGDEAANSLPPFEALPDALGLNQAERYGGGWKYLPAILDPRLWPTDMGPEVCNACKGSGYVYAPVRIQSSTDETRYQLIQCDRCQGTGRFTDTPAEPDIASMPVQGNPMEQMQMEAPEIPQPETQERNMWCHYCNGRGGQRVMVPDEDGEGQHPEFKLCEKCNGEGRLKFVYEASLSPKERAEAWDKPRIKLTAAQQAYVDGLLIKSDTWQF